MNTEAATEYLGISPRQLTNYVSAGRLNSRKVPKPGGGFSREFDETELREFKASMGARPGRIAGSNGNGDEHSAHSALSNVLSAERQTEFLNAIVGAAVSQTVEALEARRLLSGPSVNAAPSATVAPAVPLADKLLLTMGEAAALSGLSKAHLSSAAREGTLQARTIGRGRKVTQDALRAYVASIAG